MYRNLIYVFKKIIVKQRGKEWVTQGIVLEL